MRKIKDYSKKDADESLRVFKAKDDFERETTTIWLDNAILDSKVEELEKKR